MRERIDIRGFTLVELAITLVIIGLLIGGVLAGQRLKMQSELVATIADVRAYSAATATFLDRYSALPGDLKDANDRIPGCGQGQLDCESGAADASVGDGDIGILGAIAAAQVSGGPGAARETVLFWSHLLLADLISGVTSAGAASTAPDPAWGETHPTAPVGGGFHIKDANGSGPASLPGWPPLAEKPSGTFLLLQAAVDRDLVLVGAGEQVLSPLKAAFIDRKVDDGDPYDGAVVGYGTVGGLNSSEGCFGWTGVDQGRYHESSNGLDCGLAFQIAP